MTRIRTVIFNRVTSLAVFLSFILFIGSPSYGHAQCLNRSPAQDILNNNANALLTSVGNSVPLIFQNTDQKIKDACEEIGVYASFGLFFSYFIDRKGSEEKMAPYLDLEEQKLRWKKVKKFMDSNPTPLINPSDSLGAGMGDAWELINAPSIHVQEYAMKLILADTFESFLKDKADIRNADPETYFETFDLDEVEYPDSMGKRFDQALEDAKVKDGDRAFSEKFAVARKKAKEVCGEFGLGACYEALSKVADYSKPTEIHGGYIAPMSLIKEISTDSIYLKTSIHLARIVKKRLKNARDGKTIGGDLFSDLETAAKKAGVEKSKVSDIAWNLLGLYGARGASFNALDLLVLRENAPMFAAMRFVSTAITVLDTYASKKSKTYSLPPGLKTSCNFGRPYHFWYPAYLTRWLKKQGTPASLAESAVYLAGVGYQFASPTTGHDIREAFKESSTDYYNNNTRFSLTFNAAGVLYGSRDSAKRGSFKVNLDPAIKKTWKASRPLPLAEEDVNQWISDNPIGLFFRWNSVVSPLTPISSLRREISRSERSK